MGTPFLCEIKICAFNFPPKGWAMCNGQFLPIAQNQALFSLLGTTYGGNGQTTFALPDLRGRVPLHFGNGFSQGQRAGAESHTVSQAEMPTHLHSLVAASVPATTATATGKVLAQSPRYASGGTLAALNPGSLANTGGSQPHSNLQPLLVLNFCIALQGVFPSQN